MAYDRTLRQNQLQCRARVARYCGQYQLRRRDRVGKYCTWHGCALSRYASCGSIIATRQYQEGYTATRRTLCRTCHFST
eukprot:315430-Rhodomonas_salina.1